VTPEEVRLLEARWRLGEITPQDLHAVADELLDRGEDNEALIELFALDRDELRWRGADAFESLLHAWGGGAMQPDEAVRIFVRELAAGVVSGALAPLEATGRADLINVHTGYNFHELLEWADLHEELGYLNTSGVSYLGRDRASVEADVHALAHSILERQS
jgi:hypothetical protein